MPAFIAGLSKKEILDLHIDFLDFQVRTYNVLTAYGIEIVKDLVTFEEHQILKFKNAGRGTLIDIIERLADVDLHFGMTPNDIDKILNEDTKIIINYFIISSLNSHIYIIHPLGFHRYFR